MPLSNKELISIQLEQFTKVNGREVWGMEQVKWHGPTQLVTLAHGNLIKRADRASFITQKAMFTKVVELITRRMASEFTQLLKVNVMKDIGRMVSSMDITLRPCYMVPSMKANTKWVKKKARVNTHTRMEQFTKVSLLTIWSKDMANKSLKMARSTTDNGRQATCKDTEPNYTKTG